MKKNFKKLPQEEIGLAKQKLPHEVRVFLDHLECGLDCLVKIYLTIIPAP